MVQCSGEVSGESEAIADLPIPGNDIIRPPTGSFYTTICSALSFLILFVHLIFTILQIIMRPQFLYRSLGLLQRVPNRSFVPTGLGRRTLSSSPRVPDFAFAFEYAMPPLKLCSANNNCLVLMASSYDPQNPSPAQQTRCDTSKNRTSRLSSSRMAAENTRQSESRSLVKSLRFR